MFRDKKEMKDAQDNLYCWEKYEDDEVLIKRKQDLDFDGKPDVEDMGSGKARK